MKCYKFIGGLQDIRNIDFDIYFLLFSLSQDTVVYFNDLDEKDEMVIHFYKDSPQQYAQLIITKGEKTTYKQYNFKRFIKCLFERKLVEKIKGESQDE